MNNKSFTSLLLVSGLLLSNSVYADHNSVWGEGWANMPNDIHNTRIDTMDSDSSEFTDFVRYGAGADSVNRFDTDDASSANSRSVDRQANTASVNSRRTAVTSRTARASSTRAMRPTSARGRR